MTRTSKESIKAIIVDKAEGKPKGGIRLERLH
jgi:hypothetical protein